MIDLEKDVCKVVKHGLFLVPFKLAYEENQHMCTKLSGSMVSYTNKSDFDDIVHFLTNANNALNDVCYTNEDDGREARVFTDGNDEFQEGDWETRDRKNIEVFCQLLIN